MTSQALPPHAQLIQMGTASWVSRILYAAAKVGLADQLAAGPKSAAELAGAMSLHAPTLHRLMRTLASLGIGNAERNGHHYFRGLCHLPKAERDAAVRAHPDLYEARGDEAFLRIDGGQIRCASLQAPGFGYSCELAQLQRIPVADWGFERLKLD